MPSAVGAKSFFWLCCITSCIASSLGSAPGAVLGFGTGGGFINVAGLPAFGALPCGAACASVIGFAIISPPLAFLCGTISLSAFENAVGSSPSGTNSASPNSSAFFIASLSFNL